jgi:hypothetical protein
VKARLSAAARCEADWLIHPSLNAVTVRSDEQRPQREFQMAVWLAANDPAATLGSVRLIDALWAWSPSGGVRIAPGLYDLSELGKVVTQGDSIGHMPLDTWARSLGVVTQQLWAQTPPTNDPEQQQLNREVKMFLRATTAAAHDLAPCFDWVTSVTRVVVPLRQISGKRTNSGSSRQMLGVVMLTLQNEIQILEALVHESAHQHLFMAEGAGPLVDPTRSSNLFRSPLRTDLRPLRGILLAYHALAYICAYYVDALSADLAQRSRLQAELSSAGEKMREAEATLLTNQECLTSSGRDFLARTMKIAAYGDG